MLDDSWVFVGDVAWNGQHWMKFSKEANEDKEMNTSIEDSDGKVEKKGDWDGEEWNKYCH